MKNEPLEPAKHTRWTRTVRYPQQHKQTDFGALDIWIMNMHFADGEPRQINKTSANKGISTAHIFFC